MLKMSDIFNIIESNNADLLRAKNRSENIHKTLMPRSASELSRSGTMIRKKFDKYIDALKDLIEKDNFTIDRIMWKGFSHDFLIKINELLSLNECFSVVVDEINKINKKK
jgi:hypothetical protein